MAINGSSTTPEAIDNLASSVDRMVRVMSDFDITPTPSKKQWVRDSAVGLAIGMMSMPRTVPSASGAYEKAPIANFPTLEAITQDAIAMAEQIWQKTRMLEQS